MYRLSFLVIPLFTTSMLSAPQSGMSCKSFLKDKGIFTGIHYPIPVHLQKAMEFLGYKQGDLPVTEQVVTEILSLPMYAELSDDEINYVAEAIRNFYD